MGKKSPQTLLANWHKPEKVTIVLSKQDGYIYADIKREHPNLTNGGRTDICCTGERGDMYNQDTRKRITAMFASNNANAETFIRLEDGTLDKVETLTL